MTAQIDTEKLLSYMNNIINQIMDERLQHEKDDYLSGQEVALRRLKLEIQRGDYDKAD